MSWLQTLFSGGDTVKAIGETVDKLFTSDDERLERENEKLKAERSYELEMAKLETQALQNQTDINKIEAASSNLFVSGWRPFVGWVCGFALAYASIIEPFLRFAATIFGYTGSFPVIDTEITLQVLIGILGLGVFRTYERKQGVHRE